MRTRVVALLLAAAAVSTFTYARRGRQGGGQTPVLAEEVKADLLFLREEEKLARDVYLFFYDEYQTPIFSNIAASEQNHMDAVKGLLDTYGLDDPAAGLDVGEFALEELQDLFDLIVFAGLPEEGALEDALYLGAYIEEYDILDIMGMLEAENLPDDVRQVCENLLRGSRNHLRAFVGQWEAQRGEAYVPQLVDDDLYASIIEGSTETGGNGAGRRGR